MLYRLTSFYLLSAAAMLSFVLTSCNAPKDDDLSVSEKNGRQTESKEAEKSKSSFYKKMVGNINGKLSITMHLIARDSALSGKYFYNNVGIPIEIEGFMKKNGQFELVEFDFNYNETGRFKGQFITPNILKGNWRNGEKTFTFELRESLPPEIDISLLHFETKDCSNREKFLKNPRTEYARFTDTICSEGQLDFLEIRTKNKAVSDKINRQLLQSLDFGNVEVTKVEDYFSQFVLDEEAFEYFESSVIFSVFFQNSSILTIEHSDYLFAGGAHGNGTVTFTNFDLNTGNKIEFNDIFKPNFITNFASKAELAFVKYYGKDGWFYTPGKFELTTNFALTSKGILFLFNQYEVGPYAAGRQKLFFTYKECAKFLKSKNPISSFF